MITTVDEGKGLVKVAWADVRDRIAKIEPLFVKLVDELSPDKSFPLYLAYYPYGDLIGDTHTTYIPKYEGGHYRLSSSSTPKEVIAHLGYGMNSAPLALVVEKELEFFIDWQKENISIPWWIYTPGTFFPLSRILSKKNSRIYAPTGILSATSGARSAFMLPNIGCAVNHTNLQRDFNVQSPPPKSLYEHWNIFREIIASGVIDCSWRSCIAYFSEKWLTKLYKDPAWTRLRIYLYELGWQYTEYLRNHFFYHFVFSTIQRNRNLKPNPYLADTASHLFITALGAAPGYSPACSDNALPCEVLQKVFVDSYGLKKYFPTILQPTHFNFEEDQYPIYYSLQNPATHVFSPKSREVSSTLFEMRELQHIMRIFVEELARKDGMCADTIMSKVANEVEFNYFHNKTDRHRIVRPSHEIAELDKRFSVANVRYKASGARFASDAPFVRGCISMNKNKK